MEGSKKGRGETMKDAQGRDINYLRVSLTDKCNLRCMYCMPDANCNQSEINTNMSIEEISEIIRTFAELGIDKVRFTGGEPLVIKELSQIIYNTSQIIGIKDIALTTNGVFLEEKIEELKKSGLTRVNISMDTLDEDKYRRITGRAYLSKVKAGIRKCLDLEITPVKINVVIMKDINSEEIDDFIHLTEELPVDVRFIELMPIGSGADLFKNHFISSTEILDNHPELILQSRKKSSTAELYRTKNGKGNIGFITPLSCKFCNECNRVRLTSDGVIRPCLHGEAEYDVLPYVREGLNNKDGMDEDKNLSLAHGSLKKKIYEAVYNKPSEHTLLKDGRSKSSKNMFQIGG